MSCRVCNTIQEYNVDQCKHTTSHVSLIQLVPILTESCTIEAITTEVVIACADKATIDIQTGSISTTRITETLINIWTQSFTLWLEDACNAELTIAGLSVFM